MKVGPIHAAADRSCHRAAAVDSESLPAALPGDTSAGSWLAGLESENHTTFFSNILLRRIILKDLAWKERREGLTPEFTQIHANSV